MQSHNSEQSAACTLSSYTLHMQGPDKSFECRFTDPGFQSCVVRGVLLLLLCFEESCIWGFQIAIQPLHESIICNPSFAIAVYDACDTKAREDPKAKGNPECHTMCLNAARSAMYCAHLETKWSIPRGDPEARVSLSLNM